MPISINKANISYSLKCIPNSSENCILRVHKIAQHQIDVFFLISYCHLPERMAFHQKNSRGGGWGIADHSSYRCIDVLFVKGVSYQRTNTNL